MLCYAMLCYAMLSYAILSYAILSYAILSYDIRYDVVCPTLLLIVDECTTVGSSDR
jgi:hypothetical protein